MKYILEELRFELPRRKLVFGPRPSGGTHVIVPTLRHRFLIKPIRGYLFIRIWKKYKVRIELDEQGALSPRLIQVLCRVIEKSRVNDPWVKL